MIFNLQLATSISGVPIAVSILKKSELGVINLLRPDIDFAGSAGIAGSFLFGVGNLVIIFLI